MKSIFVCAVLLQVAFANQFARFLKHDGEEESEQECFSYVIGSPCKYSYECENGCCSI